MLPDLWQLHNRIGSMVITDTTKRRLHELRLCKIPRPLAFDVPGCCLSEWDLGDGLVAIIDTRATVRVAVADG